MLKKICIIFIKFYQYFLAPYFGSSCRFTPSCSQYTLDALEKYGLCKGLCKGGWRIVRCNPLFSGGYDPA
ncbi:membrane protein insertion efficiency factor YidD [bacterium]|nr:membrane protein insertion efficiency factor YidD [bacterium]